VEKGDVIIELGIQGALERGSNVEVATEQDTLVPNKCIGAVLYY